MKKLMITMLAMARTLASSSLALASLSTDSIRGPVLCTGNPESVKIDADRSKVTIIRNGANYPFYVKQRESDGQTSVTYYGEFRFPRWRDRATVVLSDQGDKVVWN